MKVTGLSHTVRTRVRRARGLPRAALATLTGLAAASATALLSACSDASPGPTEPPNPITAARFPECAAVEPYTPTAAWRFTCPPAVGLDSTRLRAAVDAWAAFPKVYGVLVARRGYVVLEAYRAGVDSRFRFYQQSATKSVTSALVGIAIGAGEVRDPSATLGEVIPGLLLPSDDARLPSVTVEQLLSMSAGFGGSPTGPPPLVRRLLARGLLYDPGTTFFYDDGGFHVLAVALRVATRADIRAYANERLFGPLGFGVGPAEWAADDLGIQFGSTGLRLSLREMAKLGELYLRDGVWGGAPVLPAGWVANSRTARSLVNLPQDGLSYGLGWWLVSYAGHDAFFAAGHGGQTITVVPDADMVVVITADPHDDGEWQRYRKVIESHVLPALVPTSPGTSP